MTLRLLVVFAQACQDPTRRVAMMAADDRLIGKPGYLEENLRRYERVTPESLRRTVQKYLAPERRVVVRVRPVPGAPQSGRLAGRP
jgi:predicted Zn-dependent peptidase